MQSRVLDLTCCLECLVNYVESSFGAIRALQGVVQQHFHLSSLFEEILSTLISLFKIMKHLFKVNQYLLKEHLG
jgi:hypothetical protein